MKRKIIALLSLLALLLSVFSNTCLTIYATAESTDSPKTITEDLLIGEWSVDSEYTTKANGQSLTAMFGNPYSDTLVFDLNNSIRYYVNFYGGSGTYQIANNSITYNITTDYDVEEVDTMHCEEINGTLYLVHIIHDYTLYWKKDGNTLKSDSQMEADITPTKDASLSQIASTENSADTGYSSAVKDAIDLTKEAYSSTGYGALFDIDGNGVEELIMVYECFIESANGYAPHAVTSVYTIKNSEVVPLIDKSPLYIAAGGPSGNVGIVRLNSNIYFAITAENGELPNRQGFWKLYSITDASIALDTEVQYSYYEDFVTGQLDQSKSSASINGKKCSYTEYEAWKKSLEDVLSIDTSYYNDPPENIMALDDLLIYLQENPISGESETSTDENSEIQRKWISQHLAYYHSEEYQSEIVPGYSGRMLAVFRDALDDGGIKGYSTAQKASKFLELDFDLTESELYELILAQIMNSSTGLDIATDSFGSNLVDATIWMAQLMETIAQNPESATKIPTDTLISIHDLCATLKTLADNSAEFGSTFSKIIELFNDNISKSEFKSGLINNFLFTGLGIQVDNLFEKYDALDDIVQYIINYKAFQATSLQLQEVLNLFAYTVYVEHDTFSAAEKFDELYGEGFWDSLKIGNAFINWTELTTALESFLTVFAESKQANATAVAEYAVERMNQADENSRHNAIKAIAIFGVESLLSQVPILNTIIAVKNITSVGLNVGVLLAEFMTNVDEREYALDMMTKIYCISVMLDDVVHHCGDLMTEDDFYNSTVFDEAINVYSCAQSLGCDFAVKYTELVLANAIAELEEYDEAQHLFNSRDKLVTTVSWFTNSLRILKEQRDSIQNTLCHDSSLVYDANSNSLTYAPTGSNAQIYIIACPVDVTILNKQEEQVAYLSGEDNVVASGLEFYFRTIKIPNDSNEYIKVAIVPEGYQIQVKGTANGKMNAFVTEFSDTDVKNVDTYFNIPIEHSSEGRFEVGSTENNSKENLLVIGKTEYISMDTIDDLPINHKSSLWIWVMGGIVLLGITVVLFLLKKRKK